MINGLINLSAIYLIIFIYFSFSDVFFKIFFLKLEQYVNMLAQHMKVWDWPKRNYLFIFDTNNNFVTEIEIVIWWWGKIFLSMAILIIIRVWFVQFIEWRFEPDYAFYLLSNSFHFFQSLILNPLQRPSFNSNKNINFSHKLDIQVFWTEILSAYCLGSSIGFFKFVICCDR